MTKARDLADLISADSILSDGAIEPNEITGVTVSSAEINRLSGVTSNVQGQLDVKGTVSTLSDLGITATTGELNNVAGVNSSVQTQLDAKASATDLSTAIAGLGTASALDVGTGANQVVQLDGSGQLPALNASNLTGIDGVSAAALLKYGAL